LDKNTETQLICHPPLQHIPSLRPVIYRSLSLSCFSPTTCPLPPTGLLLLEMQTAVFALSHTHTLSNTHSFSDQSLRPVISVCVCVCERLISLSFHLAAFSRILFLSHRAWRPLPLEASVSHVAAVLQCVVGCSSVLRERVCVAVCVAVCGGRCRWKLQCPVLRLCCIVL